MVIKTAQDPEFYDRSAVDLAKELPGELVFGPRVYLVQQTEAFNGLIRRSMENDYQQKERKPGDLCVTNFRGWPQLNVVGKEQSGRPQLTWMKDMLHGEASVKNAALVREIAESRDQNVANNELFDFAVEHLDGTSVLDPESPLCIVSNSLEPLPKRRIKFQPHAGQAENSGGIATLGGISSSMDSNAWLRAVVAREAERLEVDPD